MDNVKGNVTKNKTLKKVFCYFGLVILTILLFLPLAFKIIFKEKEEEVPQNVVEMLTCEKDGESISSSFKNGDPYNLLYMVRGDFSNKSDIEEIPDTEEAKGDENKDAVEYTQLLNKIYNQASFTYDEEKNISSFSVNVSNIRSLMDYELIFITINNQEYYYTSLGFNCSRKTI